MHSWCHHRYIWGVVPLMFRCFHWNIDIFATDQIQYILYYNMAPFANDEYPNITDTFQANFKPENITFDRWQSIQYTHNIYYLPHNSRRTCFYLHLQLKPTLDSLCKFKHWHQVCAQISNSFGLVLDLKSAIFSANQQCCSTRDRSWSRDRSRDHFLKVSVSESTAFLLGLVSVSDKEDSGFYFKTTTAGISLNCLCIVWFIC